MIDSSCGISFYGFSGFLWLLFPFMELSGKVYLKIHARNVSLLFHLYCYSQVASIFTFISNYSVKLSLLKCLRLIETKKLLVTVVVPKLQSSILLVTRRDVQLEHCIVPNVLISPQSPGKS